MLVIVTKKKRENKMDVSLESPAKAPILANTVVGDRFYVRVNNKPVWLFKTDLGIVYATTGKAIDFELYSDTEIYWFVA